MKNRYITRTATLLILACCLPSSTAKASGAPTSNVNVVNTPTVTMPTHLGIPVVNLITIKLHGDGRWSAVLPDGSEVDPYALPAGQELLITDISWLITGGTAGGVADFFFNAGNTTAWEERQILDANGNGVRSEHLTSPIPFPVLPTVSVSGASLNTPFWLRGYVVPR